MIGDALKNEALGQSGGEARSLLYALFAKALSHPSKEIIESLASGRFASEIHILAQEAGCDSTEQQPLRPSQVPEDIETSYASSFEAGLPKVSLREAHYVQEGEKTLFEDLFRFYDHFGLDTSSGGLREWPDHVAVELEFMHYLAWLEVSAGENIAALRQAQRDFLSRHLGHFVQGLADRIEQKNITNPYPQIARLLADFVAKDATRLEG